ncbi:G-protein alpha subunit-domain-containing protein [Mycena amicta]|nr:G-protein alpha subunit-domain-containing protein [Mycena amicta]
MAFKFFQPNPNRKLTAGEIAARDRSAMIDTDILETKRITQKQSSVVILGAEGAGKATLMKQARLMLSPEERIALKADIWSFVASSTRCALEDLEGPDAGTDTTVDTLDAVIEFWGSESTGMRRGGALKSTPTFLSNPSLQYFISSLERIFDPAYVLTDADILQYTPQKTPLTELNINLVQGLGFIRGPGPVLFTSISPNIGLSRKWLPNLENVDAIIYMVDLSLYDQTIHPEDSAEPVNGLHSALRQFEEVCAKTDRTTFIVLLNKLDLFSSKLEQVPLRDHFPDFEGPDTVAASCAYLVKRFRELLPLPKAWRSISSRVDCVSIVDVNETRGELSDSYPSVLELTRTISQIPW